MITLIHGPAELLRAEALVAIRQEVADDPALADLNTTVLDGRQATLLDIQNASDTLPFLGERRLVIVEGFLKRVGSPSRGRTSPSEQPSAPPEISQDILAHLDNTAVKTFLTYLGDVPASTDLVFLEDEAVGGGPILNRFLELARGGRARVVFCQKPRRSELVDWIRNRAGLHKVRLDPAALADLAEFVGDDLRQLDQELIKLADYVGRARTVTQVDVRRLVPATRSANVFDLVNALAAGDGSTAGRLLRHVLDLDGEHPLRLLNLIGRQYRLLIQAKALQARGIPPAQIAAALNVQDWSANKLLVQANQYSFARLETAFHRIVETDEAIKTGKIDDREAMDLLLAELLER